MRKNPVEFRTTRDTQAKEIEDLRARSAYVPGTQRRLVAAGLTTAPNAIVRFYLPDAKGVFALRDAQGKLDYTPFLPEAGILKILVDAEYPQENKLTPLGLWHRFFQGFANIARVRPEEGEARIPRFFRLFGAGRVDASVLPPEHTWPRPPRDQPFLSPMFSLQPYTKWFRQYGPYSETESQIEARAMAMALPGGIVYALKAPGLMYEGRDREALLAEPRPPPELQESFRKVVERIQTEDTNRVRAWVDSLARAGVVAVTGHDTRDFLESIGETRRAVPGGLPGVMVYLKPHRFLYDPPLSSERSGWI